MEGTDSGSSRELSWFSGKRVKELAVLLSVLSTTSGLAQAEESRGKEGWFTPALACTGSGLLLNFAW
jgi:hypothetical protein